VGSTITFSLWHKKTERVLPREEFDYLLSGGAEPNTLWLDGCLTLDEKGFLKTGSDLLVEDLGAAHWPLTRRPYMLETSMPGDFAVGDVRDGSVKCVASAVSAGSIAISFMHQNLAQ
jgi:thioredoxin reductase (NADPH)